MEIELAYHRNIKVILCYIEKDPKTVEAFKQSYPEAKWSRSKKVWFLRDNLTNRKQLNIPLPEMGDKLLKGIMGSNREEFIKFRTIMRQKAYSESTIRTYLFEFAQLLQVLKHFPVTQLTADNLNSYFLYCIKKLRYSESHVNGRRNIIKSYFQLVHNETKIFDSIVRPKVSKTPENVLSSEEIKQLYQTTYNLKHLLILKMAYGFGLRVTEIINLKLEHINLVDMQVLIVGRKDDRDRYVKFPKRMLPLYQDYLYEYQPKNYLFEGSFVDQFTVRSVQVIFKNALIKAGITKKVSIHGIGQTYISKLERAGASLAFIQELMGNPRKKTPSLENSKR